MLDCAFGARAFCVTAARAPDDRLYLRKLSDVLRTRRFRCATPLALLLWK